MDSMKTGRRLHIIRSGVMALMLCCLAGDFSVRAQKPVPELTGRVVDRADILSSTAERTLTTLLAAYEDSTTHQVAILTVSSLENQPIERYSVRVAEAWELGTAERDNGVLMVVAPSERKIRIEVGYGLESSLTDIETGRIIRTQITPAFQEGDYDAGVISGTMAILETAAPASISSSATTSNDDQSQYLLAALLLNLLVLPSVVLAAFLVLVDNFLRPVLVVGLGGVVFLGGCGVQLGIGGTDSSMWSYIAAGGIAVGLFMWAYRYLRQRITDETSFRERWKEFVFGAVLGGVFRSGRPGLNLKSSDESDGTRAGSSPDTSDLFGSSVPARTAQKLLEVLIFVYSTVLGFVLLANPVTAIPLVIGYFIYRSKQSSTEQTREETASHRRRPAEAGGAAAGW